MSKTGSPTIYDVAERAGVSKSLVSLVLRGGKGVSMKRRLAVEAAIEALGYRPSLAATSLAGNRTGSIGVVIDDYTNLWFVSLIRGMEDELFGHDQHVTVTDLQLNARLGGSPVDGFLAMRVEGLVIAAEPTPAMIEALTGPGSSAIPTVVAGGRELVVPGADTVAIDEEAGSRLVVDHLAGLGHTRIGHLTGLGGSAAHRRIGYEQRMAELGLTARIAGTGAATNEPDGYAAATALLDAHPDVTAVFAANDTMALGALAAIVERGLRVPDDVSLVGFDNSPLAGAHHLSFTTVDDRGAEVGAAVTRALLSRIADPTLPPRATLVAPALVVRTSTGLAPA